VWLAKWLATLVVDEGPAGVTIAGINRPAYPSPADSHFSDLNILGVDYCSAHNIAMVTNSHKGTARLLFHFESDWEVQRKP